MQTIDGLNLVEPGRYAERGYPHEDWAQLRRETPVQFFEPPGWPPFWAIAKHAGTASIASWRPPTSRRVR
ncbi:MAG: hypothetical protein ACE5HV_12115 [Acidobacteriota bacterium]